jgi:hypothetical protein
MKKETADTLFNINGIVLGATYTGKFKSFYTGKTPPQDTVEGTAPFNVQPINESVVESKMVVIGDADFANEENRPPQDNIIFFVNMVDYLADDVGLTEIRSKEISEAPIEGVSDGTKKFIKYFNLIFPPGFVLLIGLYMWNRRKLRKKTLQST